MAFNPDDYGPGKKISPEQAVEFLQHNWSKILIMLMLRAGSGYTVIGDNDLQAIERLPADTSLGIKMNDDGIHLFIIRPGDIPPGTPTARNDH